MINLWIARWQAKDKAQRLYHELNSHTSLLPSQDVIGTSVLRRMVELLDGRYPYIQGMAALEIVVRFYVSDNFHDDKLPPPPDTDDLVQLGRYQDLVSRTIQTHRNSDVLATFIETFAGGLARFFARAPTGYLCSGDELDALANGAYPGPFSTTLGDVMSEPGAAVQDLMFSFFSDEAIKAGLFRDLRHQLDKNFKTAKGVYPARQKGSATELAELYLSDTLFDGLFQLPVPFRLPEEARRRHQWVIGGSGSGKTTLISAMLLADLEKVAAGQASVFVMDSQNELIPQIAKLAVFGPGGPLEGKLIYLEPDPDHPLALNIFDMNAKRLASLSSRDRMLLERGAIWMVEFFLSSLVKAEASAHQDIFLKYVIPALLAIPDATIFTFKELLEPAPDKKSPPPGYEKYKRHFSGLRPDVQAWLAERLHSQEIAVTRNAIRARLDGFTADPFFHDMFIHPRNRLDLFEELLSAKVILVNTMKGLLKSGTEPFGRYFIAKLLQAAEERMMLKRSERLPVYAYIDEASDYISEEENVEELLDKARKQNVAFIFANQRASQITLPTVREALSRAAIQCAGQPNPDGSKSWTISIDGQKPLSIDFPVVDFFELPSLDDDIFADILDDMHELYYKPPDRAAPPEMPAPNRPEPEAPRSAPRPSVERPPPPTVDTEDDTKPQPW